MRKFVITINLEPKDNKKESYLFLIQYESL